MSTPLRIGLIDPESVTRDTDLRIASMVDEPWFPQARADLISLREAEVAPAAEIRHPEIFREVAEPGPLTGKEIRIICGGALALLATIVGLGFGFKAIGDDVHKRAIHSLGQRSSRGAHSDAYLNHGPREDANVRAVCTSIEHPRSRPRGMTILKVSRLNPSDGINRYRVLFRRANSLRIIDCRG